MFFENDNDIFYNQCDFAEGFLLAESGAEVTAIFNEPTGLVQIADADLDLSQPFLEVPMAVSVLLPKGTVLVAPSRGNRRYQVAAKPVSKGHGDALVPLVLLGGDSDPVH